MPLENLEIILNAVPMPVLLVAREERIALANTRAEALFGEGLAGRALVTVLRQPALGEALEVVLRNGGAERVRLRTSGPQEAIYQVSVTALPDPLISNGGAMLAFEDVTALEDAEAMRRDFVANVSHELRTPLTAVMGFVETLRGAARDDPAARDRFLSIMEREASRMNRLVGDLLSLSRVEAEARRRPAEKVDLSAVVAGAMQLLKSEAEARGVALIRAGESGPAHVPGDPDQLTQVVTNLIENAMKYGGSGGEVRIEIAPVAHEPVLRGAAIRVDVIDKGEGIEAMHLPRLTERFYRVDSHRSREQGGTGLGLAIVKHIIARHRGRLRIESEKGKGSRFSVILPVA